MDQQRECESGASLGGEHTATPLVMYRTRLECCFSIPCNKRKLDREGPIKGPSPGKSVTTVHPLPKGAANDRVVKGMDARG